MATLPAQRRDVFMKECVVASCFCGVQKRSFDDCKIVGFRLGSIEENCTCTILHRLLTNRQ